MLIKKHFSNELLHESPTVFTDLIKKKGRIYIYICETVIYMVYCRTVFDKT